MLLLTHVPFCKDGKKNTIQQGFKKVAQLPHNERVSFGRSTSLPIFHLFAPSVFFCRRVQDSYVWGGEPWPEKETELN